MTLEMERKMDEQRKQQIAEIAKNSTRRNAKKDSRKDTQMEQMRKTIEELKRKRTGIHASPGDAQEINLKNILHNAFPSILLPMFRQESMEEM